MRPVRFQEFCVKAMAAAPDVTATEPWQAGTKRPYGLKVAFSSGAQLWLALTVASPPGDDFSQEEVPVQGELLPEVAYPELLDGGKVTPVRAEEYLAAALQNAGSDEIASVYGYSRDASVTRPTMHPGVGVIFHSGGRGFLPMVHTARAGQGMGQRGYDLQTAF